MTGEPYMLNCFPNSFGRPLLETGEYFDWSPSVDISETGQEYLIHVALPAIEKEDVKLTYEDGTLTLGTERREREQNGNNSPQGVENYCSFALPDAIDADAIGAESKDGLLTIRVPKASEAQAKRITTIEIR